MKTVKMFTDGSSLGNPGPGGYCALLRYKKIDKVVKGGEEHTTNNRMELKAVIEGIRSLKETCIIELHSDSMYVVKGINDWLNNWIKRDFKKIKNADLWREYVNVSMSHKITANWVPAHSGHIENEKCDKIAKDEAEKQKRKFYEIHGK